MDNILLIAAAHDAASEPSLMQTIPIIEAARHQVNLAEYGGASREAVNAAFADLAAAERAVETPADKIKRMLVEARDLDAQADRFWAQEADLAGRIAYCQNNGNDALAETLEGQQRAVTICANQAQDAALRIKLDRMGLIAQQELLAVVHPVRGVA